MELSAENGYQRDGTEINLIISYKGLSPVIRVRHLPNSFEISDMLKLTGYYSADYLPECDQEKTMENVITYIKTLEGYEVLPIFHQKKTIL